MDSFASTSIVAAFLAGIAALFAPCCITVLLPSYLGSVFKERYKVVLMTFVFFVGILTVFLPIGLGASALARVFSRYHNFIFTLGGLMLVVLGIFLISGKKLAMPSPIHPTIKGYGVLSIFLLGIFSAIATTCCAPVLAGVLAMSAASGSIWWGSIYTLSYVLGMVAPLFFIAVFLDKFNFTKRLALVRRPVMVKFWGMEWRFIIAELTAGIVFLSMGIYIIYLALTNRLLMESEYQLTINLFIANLIHSIHRFTQAIPEVVWGALVVAIFIGLIIYAIKQFKKYEKPD